jgi:hypothetical protein
MLDFIVLIYTYRHTYAGNHNRSWKVAVQGPELLAHPSYIHMRDISLRKVVYTRCDVAWFVEWIDFTIASTALKVCVGVGRLQSGASVEYIVSLKWNLDEVVSLKDAA